MAKSRLGNKPLDWIKKTEQDDIPENVILSNIEYVSPKTIKPSNLNKHFRKENEDYFKALQDDIKERGILVPLIAKRGGSLLSGHNRLIIATTLRITKIPVQFVETELSKQQEREFIFKDNILRRQLTAKDKEELIRTLYAGEILTDNRGGDRKSEAAKNKSSSELTITLPEKIEKETGIKAGTAKRILAKIRKKDSIKKYNPEDDDPTVLKMKKILKHLNSIERILACDESVNNIGIFKQIDDYFSSLKVKYLHKQ